MKSSLPRPCRLLLALLPALWLAFTGCSKRETPVELANQAGIMIVGNGAEPATLDPQIVTGIPERNIVCTLFEGLTRSDPTTLEAQPGAAERWEISADGLLYTFHLRPGMKWSDGVPLTARDFYASFRRLLSPGLASDNTDQLYPVVNAEDYHKGRLQDFSAVGFRVIDDLTLEIRLAHPAPYLLKTMAARSWFPVPLHVIEKHGDPLLSNNRWSQPGTLVGNGPFVIKDWKADSHLEVARSPTYWNREAVKLNGVRFLPIENFTGEEAAFRSGQLHKTNRVPLAKIAVYRREAPEKLKIHPYSGVYYFNFNVNRPPFTDVRVRRALAMAVDREQLVANVTRADEIPAYHFTLEGIDGYVSEARTKLDFDEARRLLAEAGYPGGKGLEPITLIYNTAENHRLIAETIQQVWKRELGIDLRLENMEWKVYLDNMQNENYQLCRAGLIMEPYDASQFLRVFTSDSGFNRTGWSDPEYDRLYKQLVHTADRAKRLELMQRMEKILTDAMPILPVYYYTNQYLMDPSVRGWSNNLLALGPFEQVWLE
ncbi:peptide ABC transporter substrate-binding protein [Oleiharenicola lentus]|uniref:Peptide ABC transporter substrate-binding protein n=1 Tax=Oleiharenicola lentus TaxID=2508720 RepID=A0A4Q1C6G5_9BACT|nr:peptide ABC transporter substrate-binding protein [Oleiharenicola lentus]RXK54378.1 peptide ABC transporter substrate-binding protein [Oleiharenicola lentus]